MKEKKGVREWQVRREDIEGREEGGEREEGIFVNIKFTAKVLNPLGGKVELREGKGQ